MRMWLVAMVLSGCLGGVVVPIGGPHRSRAENQRTIMEEDFVPVALDYEDSWKQPVREVKVRVWADDKYRAENFHWEKSFDQQVEQVNAVLGPKLGIRLVVVQHSAWSRYESGSTLQDDLMALEQEDDASGAFVVIGLVSGQSLVTATFDQLGIAYIGGKHVVVRGYADLEERKQFQNGFPDVPADEREAALLARKKHKLTTVLLHELGHSLGVDHEDQPDTLMNAGYSRNMTGFSTTARTAILDGIDQRLNPQLASTQQVQPRGTHKLELTMLPNGDLMQGGNIVQGKALSEKLEHAHQVDPDTEVVVRKAAAAPESAVEKLRGRAAFAGLSHVTVTTY